MIFEVCIDNLETAIVADKLGCTRVELCSALSVGGLTPSYGLIKACVEKTSLEIHVMIRHKAGGFVINDRDLDIMKHDIKMAKKAGANGIVFGCLTVENEIDIKRCKVLIVEAKTHDLEVTFHRAFDFLSNPFTALYQLIELGADRILTSGQKPTAIDGVDLITELVKYSNHRIQIMAGSGVNAQNAIALANVGVDALHFTAHHIVEHPLSRGMGQESQPDELKIKSILNLFQ